MSVRTMTAVWGLELPDSQKIVLLALADCANDEGQCWPSMASLCKKCSKSERTVQGVVKELVSAGHLTRDERPGKGILYTVHPAPAKTAPRKDCAPQGTTVTPAAAADKPSRTTNVELAKANPTKRAKPTLPDWMPVPQWEAYLAMRKAQRKSPTAEAARLLIAKLERWRACGHDPGLILDNSTENSWIGIFEPKAKANGTRTFEDRTTGNAASMALARLGSGGAASHG